MPYFERKPTLPSAFREHHYRLRTLERISQESATQTFAFQANVYPDWYETTYTSGARVNYTYLNSSGDITNSDFSCTSTQSAVLPPVDSSGTTNSGWSILTSSNLTETRARNQDGLLLNNIGAQSTTYGTQRMTLLQTTISSSNAGLIELYARLSADAPSGDLLMNVYVDDGNGHFTSQANYLSWVSGSSLTERRTAPASTAGTTTQQGAFVVVDNTLPNVVYDESSSTLIASALDGLVLNEGLHTLRIDLVSSSSGNNGSLANGTVSIRAT